MVVIFDSYMGMFLPQDIGTRISEFMAGNNSFPFIEKDETTATFYLFGKNKGVIGENELRATVDLAQKTTQRASSYITLLANNRNRITADFIRHDYTKRALQISLEVQNERSFDFSQLNERIATDPTILSACFAQHIAHYNQDYFFELLGPFNEKEIPNSLLCKLQGRMLLLAYNAANAQALPFKNTLVPFLDWMKKVG
jgi:hypothetical protein